MCRAPTTSAVEALLLPFLASDDSTSPTTVTSIRGSPSLRLPRTYAVELSSAKPLQLILSPPSVLRLLRFERSLVESEIIAIRFLHSKKPTTSPLSVPNLIHASSSLPNPLDSPFIFFHPTRGNSLEISARSIPHTARKRINKQLGSLLRRLATLSSPSGNFGPIAAVVPPNDSQTQRKPQPSSISSGGETTWSLAFQALLEGILRDGEDWGVGIPYVIVRKHFARSGHILDGVKTARLVVVDGGKEANVLVVEEEGAEDGKGEGGGEKRWTVTGLHDWSGCIFGDPLFSTVLSEGVSEGFMEGWNEGDNTTPASMVDVGGFQIANPSAVVDDVGNASTRLLLYKMYHALVNIVREFYRPRSDSSSREMEARKRLNEVLGKLAAVPETGEKRVHRRMSGEMSPAKRVKGDEGGVGIDGASGRC